MKTTNLWSFNGIFVAVVIYKQDTLIPPDINFCPFLEFAYAQIIDTNFFQNMPWFFKHFNLNIRRYILDFPCKRTCEVDDRFSVGEYPFEHSLCLFVRCSYPIRMRGPFCWINYHIFMIVRKNWIKTQTITNREHVPFIKIIYIKACECDTNTLYIINYAFKLTKLKDVCWNKDVLTATKSNLVNSNSISYPVACSIIEACGTLTVQVLLLFHHFNYILLCIRWDVCRRKDWNIDDHISRRTEH